MSHKKTINKVIVKVPSRFFNKEYVTNEKGEKVELIVPISVDNERKRVRNYGEVVSVVEKLLPEVINQVYSGAPSPNTYRSSDMVETAMKRGREKLGESRATTYEPYTHESHDYILNNEQPILVQPGDRVYFHYNCLATDSYMESDKEGNQYYLVNYSELFCVIKRGDVVPLNANVFVSPVAEEGYEKIDVQGKDVYAKFYGSIIASVKDKPKYLNGKVDLIGEPFRNFYLGISRGDEIMFRPQSEYEIEVEGTLHYCMNQNSIFAVKHQGQWQPVGEYLFINPESNIAKGRQVHKSGDTSDVPRGTVLLLEETVKKEHKDRGQVLKVSAYCYELQKGDYIIFADKSFYNLYVEELDCMVIKYQDVYLKTIPE